MKLLLGASLVGLARAYISPIEARQVLTEEFLRNEVIVTPDHPEPGCTSYPVNFSNADITNNFLGGIEGFPLTPGPCYDANAGEYDPCPSQTVETMVLEGVAENLLGERIDCVISLDPDDPDSADYTTPEGNNGRQREGTLFSIGVLSFNKVAPLLFSFELAGNPIALPEFVFGLLDLDSDGADGSSDLANWPDNNDLNENFVIDVSLREYAEVSAVDGILFAYYVSDAPEFVHEVDTPTEGTVTVKSAIFGSGSPIELEEGGVVTVYDCPSDWNDADDNTEKAEFLSRITPTVSTCDDGNPQDPVTIGDRIFTTQQQHRTAFFRFFDTTVIKVKLYTIGIKTAREVSRNYLFAGINQPFPCPPPPSIPPSAPPPPYCDVCTERDPQCTEECVQCLDLAVNKDPTCSEACIACLETAYADGTPTTACATDCASAGEDYVEKCGPVEACAMKCSAAGVDYAEQCGPYVICEFCDRKLAEKPFCLKGCQACFPAKLLCSECADPDSPYKNDVRCSTEGPYACVDEYPITCFTSPLNQLCPQCQGEDIEYCLDCFPPVPPMPPPFPPPFPPKKTLKYDAQRYDPNRHFHD